MSSSDVVSVARTANWDVQFCAWTHSEYYLQGELDRTWPAGLVESAKAAAASSRIKTLRQSHRGPAKQRARQHIGGVEQYTWITEVGMVKDVKHLSAKLELEL